MARVLVLNQYYPPDTSATARIARDVACALTGAGHGVTIVAGRPSYEPTARYAWRPLRRTWDSGTTVERVGSFGFSRSRMPGRVANYVSYLSLALLRGLLVPADTVLAMTDPPVAVLIAALVAGARRLPLVYNVRDLHPDMAAAAGLIRPGVALALWARLHGWALRRATRVIVLGDDMRRRVIAKGVAPERVVVVRDGAVLPTSVPPLDTPLTRSLRAGFPFVVLHAGNLGFAGAWDTLIEAARGLSDDGVGFVFVGGGAVAETLRARAGSMRNVRFFEPRPAAEVPQLLAAADLHVVTLRRGLEGVVVPSKLYPILAAGRPVLAVAPETSDVASIVRDARCGWVIDPDDPAGVVAAVREAMHDPTELAARAARAGAAAPRFDRAKLLGAYVHEVEQALSF